MNTKENIQAEINKLQNQLENSQRLLSREESEDMKKMINEEVNALQKQIDDLNNSLKALDSFENSKTQTLEDENIDPNVIILEIRAGTGGSEAALFASDLLRMYTRYAENKNWSIEIIALSEETLGGIKSVIVEIKGSGVYNKLENESGVHRVQRIPVTESSGRIHTSTATVAVLPKVTKIQIEINPVDLKWDFFRSGGAGGQNVNKVSTAVRLTHIPTETVVECQQERTQGRNREKALDILRSRLFSMMTEQQVGKISELRATQVGTGERSEKIRTYNFPQDRITDHRINRSWHNIETIVGGNLDDIVNAFENSPESPQELHKE